jgi:hypothetical protein
VSEARLQQQILMRLHARGALLRQNSVSLLERSRELRTRGPEAVVKRCMYCGEPLEEGVRVCDEHEGLERLEGIMKTGDTWPEQP